jgi:tetratricopeptide (TPR) repeat protein
MFNKAASNMATNNQCTSTTNNTNTNNTNSTNKTTINTNNTKKTTDIPIPDNSIMGKLNKIKEAGNDLFRQGKYGEANDKYYEVLNEITYVDDDNLEKYRKELDDLELLCRLNIANVKLKIEDYDLALRECVKVLKKNDKNFKANYRAGICYYKKCNFSKALECFTKAKEINSTEEAQQGIKFLILVERYIKECKRNCEPMEEEKVTIPKEEIKIEKNVKTEEQKVNLDSNSNNETKAGTKRERLKDILEKNNSEVNKNDDISIENDKRPKSKYYNNLDSEHDSCGHQCSHQKPAQFTPEQSYTFNDDKFSQAKEQFTNMVIYLITYRKSQTWTLW